MTLPAEIAPEVVARMVELVRDMAACPSDIGVGAYKAGADAREIAALLPEPVVTDPDVLIVRAVLHAHQRAMTSPDSGWGDQSYEAGSYDHLPIFQAALAAYKRGRELAGGAA